jgi:bifunctional UDP-N-acetylglucosamine pyrophosphorylase/glucosamine-1-phosphate N-acetyltransferase
MAANECKPSLTQMSVPFAQTLGVNTRSQLAHAEMQMRHRIIEQWMEEGVTFVDPAQSYVDIDVVLSKDVRIEPGAMLKGKTRVMENVVIGAGCILEDVLVEEGAQIFPYSVCQGAKIGRNCTVGPFARLRPQSILEDDVKIGNFVEVKKTTLGKGSKANHLAYLGDSDIGKNSNIGAGTITCNYDGFGKHQTSLGDGVFVGSNSTLIAPLRIDDGAYIAAGSVINRTVQKGALAIGRARQDNKEGYAERIKERLKHKPE